MIGKILIATLAAATLFIATGHAATVANGHGAATSPASAGTVRNDSIRYDGIRAPSTAVRLAIAASSHRHRF